MNSFEYIELYATNEQLKEIKQAKHELNKILYNMKSEHNLDPVEYHFMIKSFESYICDPFVDITGHDIR